MRLWQALLIRGLLSPLGLAASFFPRRLELFCGPPLGRFLMRLYKRRAVARENLERCFPGLPPQEREKILVANFEHYGILVFELLHLFSPFPGHYKRYAEKNAVLRGFENWEKASKLGKGVLFVSSHLGNWELMVAAGSLAGMPVTMVTKHLKPEWLHKKIEASRLSVGVRSVYEPRTLPTVMRALRAGEAVGFVVDQYAGPPIGIKVPFFGVKVGTLAAVGTLSSRTGAAVLPVKTFRDARGVVNVCVEPMLELGELAKDEAHTTALLSSYVESWVRQYPAQWLWIHRRFKNILPDDIVI